MKCSSPIDKGRGALDPYDENAMDCGPLIPPSELKVEDVAKLQADLAETKTRLRTMTQKFATVRKERDVLKKESKELQNEVLTLQNNIREMIPAFSNTGSVFPMYNELQVMLADYWKCECTDVFFELLSPELSMEGVIYFFKESIEAARLTLATFFDPVTSALCKTICCDKLEGSLLSVLRKAFQYNWKRVCAECVTSQHCENVMARLQEKLSLGACRPTTNRTITEFVKKLSDLCFLCFISEPEFVLAVDTIGSRVQFNSLKHESIDGFVRAKEQAIVILPSVHKNSSTGELVVKAHVLPANYEFS